MQKVKNFPFKTIAVAFLMAGFLLFPARYTHLVFQGASLWAVCVLPATLPFLFLTSVLTGEQPFRRAAQKLSAPSQKLFRVSGAGGLAALLSLLSGYPVGAKTVSDLVRQKALTRREAFRVACLASTSGPMFLVGAVGAGMFSSAALGWKLYLSHLAGIFVICFFLRFTARDQAFRPVRLTPPQKEGNLLAESVLSVLTVGGAIAVYYAFAGVVCDAIALTGITDSYLTALITGLIEMTSGCSLLSKTLTPLSAALSAFLVTFGGGCVLTQQLSFLAPAGVRALPFIGVKLIQGACAFLIMLVLCILFGL